MTTTTNLIELAERLRCFDRVTTSEAADLLETQAAQMEALSADLKHTEECCAQWATDYGNALKQIEALSLALETERGAANLYAQQVAHWIGKYDEKLKQIAELQADADRYRWLRPRMIGVDFDYQESGATALSFEMPSNASFGANCDMNIDAAKGNV